MYKEGRIVGAHDLESNLHLCNYINVFITNFTTNADINMKMCLKNI